MKKTGEKAYSCGCVGIAELEETRFSFYMKNCRKYPSCSGYEESEKMLSKLEKIPDIKTLKRDKAHAPN